MSENASDLFPNREHGIAERPEPNICKQPVKPNSSSRENVRIWQGCLRISGLVFFSGKPQPDACPFSWQQGTSAGRQVREGGAAGLRSVGRAVEVSGIELISGRLLLDDGETGDAVERIGLHSEPGIGDLLTAAGTDSV